MKGIFKISTLINVNIGVIALSYELIVRRFFAVQLLVRFYFVLDVVSMNQDGEQLSSYYNLFF